MGNTDTGYSRRQWLKKTMTVGGLAGLAISGVAAGQEACVLTPRQGEGPYYPEHDLKRDNDLTRLKTGAPRAEGAVIYVRGTVQDGECRPLEGALVEVWQACFSGKYNHSEDPNQLKLDPNFQYWGRMTTAKDGKYEFITIVPGIYPNGPGVYRPPHIHFKAHAPGYFSLTTQMYFDPMTYDDPELQKMCDKWNKYERVNPALIVPFLPTDIEQGAKLGKFDITLRKNS